MLLCLLTAFAPHAFAQQAPDGLNDQQRLGRQILSQSCGVCHLPPARNARTYGPLLSKASGGGDDAVVRRVILEGTPRMPAFNDGTDWALGPPSKLAELPHDGGMGLDGNLYYTVNNRNRLVTIGRVDGKSGAVSYLKVNASNGEAATAHGLTRDAQGNFWFDVNPGRRSLGKLETASQKITVYETPATMTPLGGAVTMDVDGKGKIWASAPEGAVRFDPVTEQFTAFRSVTAKEPEGHVRDLRSCRRPRRQRLVGADGARHHWPGRRPDRRGLRDQAPGRQAREGPAHA